MSYFVWNKIDHLVVFPDPIANHTAFYPFFTSATLRKPLSLSTSALHWLKREQPFVYQCALN